MPVPIKSLKKQFKKGIRYYIKKGMGRNVTVVLPPTTTDCPNCIWDTVTSLSTNVFDEEFVRPVNIFPGKSYQRQVYPQPFNVTTVASGTQYDPAILDPKILRTSRCPVCQGDGVLTEENIVCIKALVTWNPKEKFLDLSAGRDGVPICRLKAFPEHYALCREAKSFTVDGVKCVADTPAKLKGLGADHLVEQYVVQVTVDDSVSIKYDGDMRVNKDLVGQVSDQAPAGTPTVPPTIPSDDGPW